MNEQGVGATAFDLPNDQNPRPFAKPYYGNQNVPAPTRNNQFVNPEAAMRAVNEAK